MLKEKATFLQIHDQVLFGKDFRDQLTEILTGKNQSIDATAEVSKLRTANGPFERGPHFIKEDHVIGGKNSDRTTIVNTFYSKRKEPFYSNS